jgi:hypothetical protein
MVKFFCSESSVQAKTIPVIATVLQLSDEEARLVKCSWEDT